MTQHWTIWVCQDCLFAHAIGEIEGTPDKEPLSLLVNEDEYTMGMVYDEHECDDSDNECDCETRAFSWSRCEGCGSNLGGSRHAFTVWEA